MQWQCGAGARHDEIAKSAGGSRENFYRSLSGEPKPEFDTIVRVVTALVQREAKPKAA
jgi:probable addiction module antidote protein